VIRNLLISFVLVLLALWGVQGEPHTPNNPQSDGKQLAQKAHAVFQKNCYACHGSGGKAEGGLFILDHSKLVASKVVPGKPTASRVLKRLTDSDDPMPPPDATPRPTAEEVEAIRAWIAAGAPAWAEPVADRKFISQEDLFTSIVADLGKADAITRVNYRYFSLVHLYNAGRPDDELDAHRLGLKKLVNSLTWATDTVALTPIDPAGVILRIDIQQLGWNAVQFDRVVAADPFALVLDLPCARTAAQYTHSTLPVVRADVFIFLASRPPIYHDLLGIPATRTGLEARLKINIVVDVQTGAVLRVGFNGSGVSQHNRVIETVRTGQFPYFDSYDFETSANRQNIFANPLGPATRNDHYPVGQFVLSGGEIIFQLPNGLLGFMVVNAKGDRLDVAPINIVTDEAQRDRTVRNGISCFRCHARGLLSKEDQVAADVARNRAAFAKDELDLVAKVYQAKEFNAHVERDNRRYRAALESAGVGTAATDPINVASRLFEADLDLARAAAEAGVTVSRFLDGVERNAELKRRVGPLRNPGRVIPRDEFLAVFPLIAREVQDGVVAFVAAHPAGTQWAYEVTTKDGKYEVTRQSLRATWPAPRSGTLVAEVIKDGPKSVTVEKWLPPTPHTGGEWERITVPAGTYRAWRVKDDAGPFVETKWYDPVIGLVKWEIAQKGPVGVTQSGILLRYDRP
jgi:mono/diheme cytochrome c family protein